MKTKVINIINAVFKRWGKMPTERNAGEERRNTMKKTAIAYTNDIILGRTGEVISRAYQKELIRQFAEENDIEVVAWFEDEVYDEEILTRPGIQKMLAYEKPYDTFLVERVWALSRKMTTLTGFLKVLIQKKVKLTTATYLWDCTSQMVRRHFAAGTTVPGKVLEPVLVAEGAGKAAVQKPETVHFDWAFAPQGTK
jgi:hypothetical protein